MGQIILPDTNIFIIGFSQPTSPAGKLLGQLIENDQLVLSTIVIAEYLSKSTQKEERVFARLFSYCPLINVDLTVAKLAGNFRKKYLIHRKAIPLADCLIAAQCKISGATLATLNPRDFPIPEIKTLNPLLPA